MKEKLIEKLGSFGMILYYVLLALISILPIAVLPVRGVLSFLLIAVMTLIPATSVIFWVWGLICAITGPQDWLAVVYYVCLAVLFTPSFISIICGLFKKNR